MLQVANGIWIVVGLSAFVVRMNRWAPQGWRSPADREWELKCGKDALLMMTRPVELN